MKKTIVSFIGICFVLVCLPVIAVQPGLDAWTNAAEKMGLFNPHENYCDGATELFLEVGASGLGFCIESSARTKAYWQDAKEDCLDENKRLPEPAEWYYACRNLTGFSASSSDFEWISNSSSSIRNDFSNKTGVTAPIGGSTNTCSFGSVGWVGNNQDQAPSQYRYRCVR